MGASANQNGKPVKTTVPNPGVSQATKNWLFAQKIPPLPTPHAPVKKITKPHGFL